MKKAIRLELWKAFHSPMLWVALAGAAVIVLTNVWACAEEIAGWIRVVSPYLDDPEAPSSILNLEGYSLFTLSLPYYFGNFSGQAFLYIWPLLAAIPYGTSYMTDRRTGVYNQIVSRIGRKKYLIAKYAAVFVTGGLVVALTVLVALLADAMVLPFWKVHLTTIQVVQNGAFLSALYYAHPWLHALCWCLVLFCIGGSVACLTFFAWTGLRLRALVAVIPFAVFFVISTIVSRLVNAGLIPSSDLTNTIGTLLYSVSVSQNTGLVPLIIAAVITVITFIAAYIQVVRHELD